MNQPPTRPASEPIVEGWSSSTTLAEVATWLKGVAAAGGRIAVITHVKPDGDAVGSTLALVRALNMARVGGSRDGAGRNSEAGITSDCPPGQAEAWYAGPIPTWTAAMLGATRVRYADRSPEPANPFDAAVILDTGSWSQLEFAKAALSGRADRIAIIDHHRQGDAEIAARRIIEPDRAAACEIVAELCRVLLGVRSCADLPREIAEPLYLGLATDTGWFKYSNVTPGALRLAADLLRAGAEPATLYQLVEQQDRPQRLRLMARALASLEFFANESIAVMRLAKADFDETRAEHSDTGGFVDLPQTIATVRVVALLIETEDFQTRAAITKISLRSKAGPRSIDVNRVAQGFGGGGHTAAAGARTPLPLDQAVPAVVAAILEQMEAT